MKEVEEKVVPLLRRDFFFFFDNSIIGGGSWTPNLSFRNTRRCQLLELHGSWQFVQENCVVYLQKTNQLHFIEKIIKLGKHDSLIWIWAILLVFQFSNEEMIFLFTPTLCPINSIIKRIKPLHSNTCPWIISLLHFNREKKGGGGAGRAHPPKKRRNEEINDLQTQSSEHIELQFVHPISSSASSRFFLTR